MTTIIRDFYQKYFPVALGVSILLHCMIIGSYYTASSLLNSDDAVVHVRVIKPGDLPPIPPSILEKPVGATFGPVVHNVKSGTPVAIPDMELRPETEYIDPSTYNKINTPVEYPADGNAVIPPQVPRISFGPDPDPEEFIAVEVDPKPVIQVMPAYPPDALRMNLEGIVWVSMLVSREGNVRKAFIKKTDSDIFNEASLTAAMKWVFSPAMMNNGPVAVWVCVPFRYRLSK